MQIKKLLIFALLLSYNLTHAQQSVYKEDVTNLLIEYEPNEMKKYEYRVDEGFIVDDHHTNYHLTLDTDRTLIFKVRKGSNGVLDGRAFRVFDAKKANMVQEDFVVRVNSGATNLYLKDRDQFLKVHSVIYKEDTKDYLSYFAYPYQSFYYMYDEAHYPAEEFFPVYDPDFRFDARTYFHGESTEKGHEKHIFLKMYRDACYSRPFGIVTPRTVQGQHNPGLEIKSEITGKMVYRSCQHHIESEYIPKIGFIREYYREENATYGSQLMSIDGIPLDRYLETFSPNGSYEEVVPMPAQPQPMADMLFAKIPDEAKEGLRTNTATNSSVTGSLETINITKSAPSEKNIEYRDGKIYHVVRKGDTLYSISRKYGTPIKVIRNMNSLESTIIEVDQQLMVREAIAH